MKSYHQFLRATVPLLTLSLLALAAPAAAGIVYVPVLDENGAGGVLRLTDILLANTGATFGEYEVLTLPVDSDGTVRPVPPVPGGLHKGRGARLTSVGAGGSSALLEIQVPSHMAVEARLLTVSVDRARTTESVVPVLSSDNALAEGSTATLLGLQREPTTGEATDFSIVNLDRDATACTIKAFLADGTQIATTAAVVIRPLSMRTFSDVLNLLGQTTVANGRMDVSCNGAFYTFATLTRRDRAETSWLTPAATGASTLTRPGGVPPPPPPVSGAIVFRADGLLHTATAATPKRVLQVPVEHELRLRRLVVDMDFTPGPWNTVKNPNNHAIFWLHRGKFRSNTIGNVNAFGPSKLTFKAFQNVDLPAGSNTADERAVQLVQGTQYHVTYTYNAETLTVSSQVTGPGGAVIASTSMAASAIGGTLTVPASGLTMELGHFADQTGPEVASFGWTYSNLRIEMVQ